MSMLQHLLPSNAVKAGASTTALSTLQTLSGGTIEVGPAVYSAFAVLLALAGVWLARLVTIGEENKKLGRTQTLRETSPLTWIGVLIVCPFIWHFDIAIPWASMIGLGVGYSVKIVLKIFGSGAVGAARAVARRAADALDDEAAASPAARLDAPGAHHVAVILPPDPTPEDMEQKLRRLGNPPASDRP